MVKGWDHPCYLRTIRQDGVKIRAIVPHLKRNSVGASRGHVSLLLFLSVVGFELVVRSFGVNNTAGISMEREMIKPADSSIARVQNSGVRRYEHVSPFRGKTAIPEGM